MGDLLEELVGQLGPAFAYTGKESDNQVTFDISGALLVTGQVVHACVWLWIGMERQNMFFQSHVQEWLTSMTISQKTF